MDENKQVKLIVVGGPTATGKTKFAIRLAKEFNGEIINADSVQVYKYLNIGSNKGQLHGIGYEEFDNYKVPIVDLGESGVISHLFDVVEPNEEFSLAMYQKLAKQIIGGIYKKGKVPILVGGTGLYIDSIIKNYKLDNRGQDTKFRQSLNNLSVEKLQERLIGINEKLFLSLNQSDRNNPRRLIRYIERTIEGKTKTSNEKMISPTTFFYPIFEKEKLMIKIDNQVELMFSNGFVKEVKSLLDRGYNLNMKSMNSIGYKQIAEMLLGVNKMNIEKCVEAVKLAQRQYAKRQITWFEGKRRDYKLTKISFASSSFSFSSLYF